MIPARKPFRLKPSEPTEAMILSDVLACLKQLQALGKVCWYARMNSGAGKLQYGTAKASQFIRFGFPGCPDVLGQLPGGRVLGIEVKRPSGRLTADQAAFIERANHSGALMFVARSGGDVLDKISA